MIKRAEELEVGDVLATGGEVVDVLGPGLVEVDWDRVVQYPVGEEVEVR